MIQQIITASHDARIGVIGALCPMRFHDQLVAELRYLSMLLKKRIVIMDERYMIHQLNHYYLEQSNNNQNITK